MPTELRTYRVARPIEKGFVVPIDLPLVPSPERLEQTLRQDEDGSIVRRTVLPSGVRILTEHMPAALSASVGFWVGVGSRDEAEGQYGSTHFLEHLLFKGTPTRSALDISLAFDRVGGEANAATTKETTCYHARVLGEDLPMAIEVISDMVTQPLLDYEEAERERGVILDELAMDADDPLSMAHEQFSRLIFGEHPLARPVGGTRAEIRELKVEEFRDHYVKHYAPETLVITAAGAVDHDAVVRMATEALKAGGWDLDTERTPMPRRTATYGVKIDAQTLGTRDGIPEPVEELRAMPGSQAGVFRIYKDIEQAQVFLGVPGLPTDSENRFALSILSTVLGGGMSSRLFQEVRERRGLAYSTFAMTAGYSDTGFFSLYAGCAPEDAETTLEVLGEQFDLIAAQGITEDELDWAVGSLAGQSVLTGEDHGARMSRLAGAELMTGHYVTLEETLEKLRAVTRDDVKALAARLAAQPRTAVILAPEAYIGE